MQKSSWIFWLLLAVVPVGCGNGDCHDGDDAIAEQDADEEEIDLIPERPPGSDTDESIAPEPLITQPLPPAPEVIRPFQLRDSYTLNAHTCAGAIQEFELSNEGDIIFGKNDLVLHVTDPGNSGIPAKTQYRAEKKVGVGGYPFIHIIIPKCDAGILLFPRQAQEASAATGIGFAPGDFYMVCRDAVVSLSNDGSEDDGVCHLSYERIQEEIPIIQSPSTAQ